MAFDVASIKQSISGETPHADFPWDAGDGYSPKGGLLSVTSFPLRNFIGFAYKLTSYQNLGLASQLPKWATTERFDVEARAAQDNPTKDQMRLMMQSLLADRFKLEAHVETRQDPVFALVLAKPGKIGPQLRPHPDDPHCSDAPIVAPVPGPEPTSSGKGTDALPAICGTLLGQAISGRMVMSGRNISMEDLANNLVLLGRLDRDVVDETGLLGKFDLTMDAPFLPPPSGVNVQPDPSAPTFLEVLQEQLGLKLVSKTGPVDVLVIDHVEEPSAN